MGSIITSRVKRKMRCPDCGGENIGGYFDETSQCTIRVCNDCGSDG